MPLQKLQFRPGLNREGTEYSNEGGWYDGDKIRFRSGFPEKIGGWVQQSANQFLGLCRSLWNWIDLNGNYYLGVGTSVKYYISSGGYYNDITPFSTTTTTATASTGYSTLNGTITASATSLTVTAGTSFASSGVILIGTEKIAYGAKVGNVLSGLTRGYGGTTAASHTTGAVVAAYTILITDTAYNPNQGDYLCFYNASSAITVGGITLSTAGQYVEYIVVTVPSSTTYTILATTPATSAATSAAITSTYYEFPAGANTYVPGTGWGVGPWGRGGWGSGYTSGVTQTLRLWSNDNFGQDLVIAPRGGPIFYWQDSGGVTTRAKYLSDLANTTTALTLTATTDISFASGATSATVSTLFANSIYPNMVITGTGIPANTKVSAAYITGSTTVPLTFTPPAAATTAISSGTYNLSYAGAFVPIETLQVISSSIQQFIIAFGSNPYSPNNANTTFNPMLVRWSDQANPYQWIPQTTNQSGEFSLTNGSYIMAARTTRQEILVWTDSALYSMQYLGPPYVWGFQVLMDNISVISPNSMVTVNNVTYWMGKEKFYVYSGSVQTLPCSLRQYIFDDLNQTQSYQIFCGANEAYNEVWWFYPSTSGGGQTVDRYVIYNYLDQVWYYGTMARTAWLETGVYNYPIAADYNNRLLYQENGVDDVATGTALPIDAYVQSSDFDIGDGHNFGFVWRILPDVNFNGSNNGYPVVTMTVAPRQNSGTAYGAADNPAVNSYGGSNTLRGAPQPFSPTNQVYTVQQFDGQVMTRLRGRQMAFRIESNTVGTAWQLGSPRIDIRPDGRR